MVTVTGNLANASGGALANVEVRVTPTENGSKLKCMSGSINTGSSGEYSFTLGLGKYLIEILKNRVEYIPAAIVTVGDDTKEELTLEELVQN